MVDLHSHILYGWDDGAESLDVSLAMAHIAVDHGTTIIAATPHLYWQNQRVDTQMIRDRVAEINGAIASEGMDLRVVTGTEIPADWENLALIKHGKALTLNDSKGILFEVPFVTLPVRFRDLVFQLRMQGFNPTLAHPERCQVFLADPEAFYRQVDDDTPVQLTSGSLTGLFGEKVQDLAWRIATDERPIIIASDAHNTDKRKPNMQRAYEALAERFDEETATLMCVANPRALIEDKPMRIARISRPSDKSTANSPVDRLRQAFRRH